MVEIRSDRKMGGCDGNRLDYISRPAQADTACANGQQNHDFVASEAVREGCQPFL